MTEPLPLAAAQRDSAIEFARAAVEAFIQFTGEGATSDRDFARIPGERPAVFRMFSSEEGNLWVEAETVPGVRVFDMFAGDGTHLGRVGAPKDRLSPLAPAVRGDAFWSVVLGELDMPYVVRYRVTAID